MHTPTRRTLLALSLLVPLGCTERVALPSADDGGGPGAAEGDTPPPDAFAGWGGGPGASPQNEQADSGGAVGSGPLLDAAAPPPLDAGGPPSAELPPADEEPAPAPEEPPLEQPHAAFCGGAGPVVEVGEGDAARRACGGDLAEALFTQALCACEDIRAMGGITTRGFDSRGDAQPGGAAVGVNRELVLGFTRLDVGGSLAVGGGDLVMTGEAIVAGDLRVSGGLRSLGSVEVARDAWLGQGFAGSGLAVGRDLHHGGPVEGLAEVAGQRIAGPVAVEAPCPCDEPLDVEAVVAQIAAQNDNDLIDLAPDALAAGGELTLPCGRYHLNGIVAVAGVRLHITGRVVLAIDGDLDAVGGIRATVDDGAELDLFVAGTLRVAGSLALGDPERPAAVRAYVAGDESIELAGAGEVVGNLYAPRAALDVAGRLDLSGSLLVRRYHAFGETSIAYDRAITDLDCPADGEGERPDPVEDTRCGGCGVCGDGLACLGGTCTGCTGDKDCCGQQACRDHRCVNLVVGLRP